MFRFRFVGLVAAVVLVAVGCGGDDAADTVPTAVVEHEPPAPVSTVVEDTAEEGVECPEGFSPDDDGSCRPDDEATTVPAETTTTVEVDISEDGTEERNDTGDTTDVVADEAAEETSVEEPEAPAVEDPVEDAEGADPDEDEGEESTVPVEEPSDDDPEEETSEEPAEETIYVQTGPAVSEIPTLLTHSADEIVWWYPNLMKDAYDLIDPNTVGADGWDANYETTDETPAHHHYVFYHGDRIQFLREAWLIAAEKEFWRTKWHHMPVRYDVSWEDRENVLIVGTYPLGETQQLTVRVDGLIRGELPVDEPAPPPLAPLPPFTEPDYPEYADQLGRNCPSVEEIWRLHQPVADPCTFLAVQTAAQFAFAAAHVEQTEAAIRDGHALVDLISYRKEVVSVNPFLAYYMNPDNPGGRLVEVRDVTWAGRFAGSSRITFDFLVYQSPRNATPEFQQFLRDTIQSDLEAGRKVPENLLGDELPEKVSSSWDTALAVRTADGTWRIGFGKWCFTMEGISFPGTPGKPLQCPDDPNPVWSDLLDHYLLAAPNQTYYWRGATRPEQLEYYGRPPT